MNDEEFNIYDFAPTRETCLGCGRETDTPVYDKNGDTWCMSCCVTFEEEEIE